MNVKTLMNEVSFQYDHKLLFIPEKAVLTAHASAQSM